MITPLMAQSWSLIMLNDGHELPTLADLQSQNLDSITCQSPNLLQIKEAFSTW
jgi:hypothetical protein